MSRKTRGPSGVCSAGGGAAGADAGAEGAFLDAGRNAPEEAFEVRSFGRPRGRKAGFTNARCSGSGGGGGGAGGAWATVRAGGGGGSGGGGSCGSASRRATFGVRSSDET
ncbi:MAG: hypothetical protein CO113_14710 [Elusimicrobia bacterium CG_4_9_14_3_um_filter_62_55]|nr:MAG: hypothetical protein COX66_03150 [Elusimicrobia bacterium CG_4_10_14_0_2_um_filter_63_34]PJB24267.1 MAG: hypothetical protein CO113_14710 [Elusimicrobia bacterium CG_4_9_14_3_um_filter_62_55]